MDTANQIREFIRDTFFVEDFGADDSFLRTGLIDSTGMIELVSFVQESFAIEIADHELVPENFDSLHKLVRFVEHKCRGLAPAAAGVGQEGA
jgi:acyl carrier protein